MNSALSAGRLYDGSNLVILDACETLNDSTELSLLGLVPQRFRCRLLLDDRVLRRSFHS